ncbi:serine-rich coiled-coil domain-containing protein 1 isoform X2 [Engraulis encrasicolus]|uniref:serine-rich coiled-coil domain-containing protein 1 isoform X2 n=1 Tax=Engraulis encrasicolus TaxID=184585 RepID=UPI002FD1BC4A
MGESGKQRSTLVSRLPIFRRSSSKKHHHHTESLPSSPSSGTNVGVAGGNSANGNGVHTSSPSSTNSSTSSTGKRRSLFRTPSLSFHSKRSSPAAEPRLPATDPLADPQPGTESQDGGGGGGHVKSRHSFGFGGHRHKKITRSQTEDFEKGSSTSSSGTNRNVFINCISSGTVEGDDSGFLDDVSSSSAKRSSSKQRKHLLPKSFSAHHRFSRNQAPETQTKPPAEGTSGPGTPGSWPGELAVESSLQSPMLSEDRTTAITPSEFVHVTEDSVSEVDALPPPSPAAPLDVPALLGGDGLLPASTPTGTSSQVLPSVPPELASEPTSLPTQTNASATVSAQCESQTTAATTATDATAIAAATTTPAVVPATTATDTGPEEDQSQAEPQPDMSEISESEPDTGALEPELSEEGSSNPEPRERRLKNPLLAQDARKTSRLDTRQGHLRKPNTVSLCSSVSPYHEVMRLERRLRSASEGAGESGGSGGSGGGHGGGGGGGGGGRRLHLSLREPHSCALETIGLHKRQRTHSSSSKLGSLDVLNNLGSSELDEDDLMLDLDLSDDQRHRHVSREDSSLSLGSCLNLMASPLEHGADRLPGETSHRELRSLSLLGRDEDVPGLEALPLRLMQQDCTAVKTLLLRLRRTLQESTDISPASSLHSLTSPCSEKSLPFKEPVKEEAQTTSTTLSNASLQQQLKEKDELIQRLQAELERLQAVPKSPCQKADRCTQTDTSLPEVLHPGRAPGQSSITSHHSNSHSSISTSTSSIASQRERRGLRPPTADLYSRPPPSPLCEPPCRPSPSPLCDPPCCPGGAGGGGGGGGEGGRGGGRDSGPLWLAPGRKGTSCDSTTMTQPLTMATMMDSATDRPPRRWEHPPASQIPRAIASSTSSLPGRGSPSCSQSSDSERGPRSERSPLAYHPHHHHHHTSTAMPTPAPSAIATPAATTLSSAVSSSSGVGSGGSSSFTGRLGQPPRGPLSLHMYSRKNVFLQHSLHTAELQALAQQDG